MLVLGLGMGYIQVLSHRDRVGEQEKSLREKGTEASEKKSLNKGEYFWRSKMANEAVLLWETGPAIPHTVHNSVAIEKGTILCLLDPMTVSGADHMGLNASAAGIAAEEKIANDGKTTIGVYTEGIFKVTLSGACDVGEDLSIGAAANDVTAAGENAVNKNIIGYALEAGADDETIRMRMNIHRKGAT